jgi:hypothetical protein
MEYGNGMFDKLKREWETMAKRMLLRAWLGQETMTKNVKCKVGRGRGLGSGNGRGSGRGRERTRIAQSLELSINGARSLSCAIQLPAVIGKKEKKGEGG